MTLAVLAGEQETECRKIVREVLLLDPRAALTSQNRTPRQFHLPRSDEKLIEAIMQLSTGPTESRLSKVLTFELLAKIDHSSRKHQWIVTDGLKPGERVVAEGTQKVRPGSLVKPTMFSSAAKQRCGGSRRQPDSDRCKI